MPNRRELIPITRKGDTEQWVDGRTLHSFLGSKSQFANWITDYINDFGFIEGRDFLRNNLKSTGGRQAIEYSITLDMAKHLAMLQRNEKGMQARQYFINAEKQLRHLQNYLAVDYQEAEERFRDCLIIEHEGEKWYAAAQLTLQVGRIGTGCGYQTRLKRMADAGQVKKINYRGRDIWFVKSTHVRDLLNVKRRMIVASQVVTLIEKGGMI